MDENKDLNEESNQLNEESSLKELKPGIHTSLVLQEFPELTEIQKKIILIAISKPELSKVGIAKEVGCSHTYVYNVFELPVTEKIFRKIAIRSKSRLIPKAMRTLETLMDTGSPLCRLKAAQAVLEDQGIISVSKFKPEVSPNEISGSILGEGAV